MIKIKLPKKIKNLISVKSNDDVIRNNQIVSKMFPEIVLDSDIRKRISLEIVKKDIRVLEFFLQDYMKHYGYAFHSNKKINMLEKFLPLKTEIIIWKKFFHKFNCIKNTFCFFPFAKHKHSGPYHVYHAPTPHVKTSPSC